MDEYFDFGKNSIDELTIKLTNDGKTCYLAWQNNFVENLFVKGFVISTSKMVSTFCDVTFYPSSIKGKFIPRLVFSKIINSTGAIKEVKKNKIIISLSGSDEGVHEFWKMVEFLAKFKELVDIDGFKGEYEVLKTSQIVNHVSQMDAFNQGITLRKILIKTNLSGNELVNILNDQRKKSVLEFEKMLGNPALLEKDWQKWFKDNSWVLGTEFVKVLEERDIDTKNISDYLLEAYDGFLDIVEIKRPSVNLEFWSKSMDHDNFVPSMELIRAITQCSSYLFEIEREANSVKFQDRFENIRVVKPRSVLIFGRSNDWTKEQKQAYRILVSSYQNISILTYDHVLDRAKRITGIT